MSNSSFVTDHQSHSLWEHVKLIEAGDYGLPEFQSTFVWDDDKVRSLWDSIYRSFPIGQVMLWEPAGEEFPMRSLGRRQSDLEECARYAVIDGQQRLTALWLVLKGEVPLRFNLEREQFFASSSPTENSIPLNLLQELTADSAEDRQLFVYCANGEQQRRHSAAILKLNARLANQKLPSQTIKHADYARVVEVFKRLNVQGVELSGAQVAIAVISTKWPGVFRRIYATLQRLNVEMGFDRLEDQDFLVRAWTAVHTNQHLIKHLAPESADSQRSRYAALATAESYEESWRKLERGLNGLTSVMRDQLDLTHFQFVKGDYPLVVLINYFAHREEISADEKDQLAKWLIMALVTSRYSVRALTKLREDIKATGAGKKLTDLFSHRYEALDPSTFVIDVNILKHETFRSAYGTLLYLLLRRRGAADWHSPTVRVGDPPVPTWHFHHIFPDENFSEDRGWLASQLETAEQDGDDAQIERIKRERDLLERRIVNIANLTFIAPATNISIGARRPSDYLAEILRQSNGEELLNQHLIPAEPRLWLHENFEEFSERRRDLIAAAAGQLLEPPRAQAETA